MIITFSELNYKVIANYVEGYLQGIGLVTGRNLLRNMHNWHCEQRREGIATAWVAYIPHLHKEASEGELINFLLSDVETYFKNNPNWQKEDVPYRWQFEENEEE